MTPAHAPLPPALPLPLPPALPPPGQETLTPDTGPAPEAAPAQRFLPGLLGVRAEHAREVTPCV